MSPIHWGGPKRSSNHLIWLICWTTGSKISPKISQLNLLTVSQKLNQLPYRGISFPCIPYSFGYNLQLITITIEDRGMVLIWIFISGFTTTDRSTYYNTGGNDTIPFFPLLVKKIPRYWKSSTRSNLSFLACREHSILFLGEKEPWPWGWWFCVRVPSDCVKRTKSSANNRNARP